jgi:hypothetical protein
MVTILTRQLAMGVGAVVAAGGSIVHGVLAAAHI